MVNILDKIAVENTNRCLKHLNRNGFTKEEGDLFYKYVKTLGYNAGRLWIPCYCKAGFMGRIDFANNLLAGMEIRDVLKPLIPKRTARIHYFWSTEKIKDGKPVILDPTGVPISPEDYKDSDLIHPYFGLQEFAPKNHKFIYSLMKDMDEWGTRDLPPGFHP